MPVKIIIKSNFKIPVYKPLFYKEISCHQLFG